MINKSHSSLNDMEALRGASILNAKNITFWGLLTQAFSFIVGISALPLRLFLRKNLGERSIRPGTFLLSIALHIYYFTIFDALFVFLGTVPFNMDGKITTENVVIFGLIILFNPYFIFLFSVTRRGIKHFRQKIREAKNSQTAYSYSHGDSKYFTGWKGGKVWGFTVDDTITRMIVEPKSIFKYGMVTFLFCLAVYLYLIFYAKPDTSYLALFLVSLACTGLVFSFDAICLFIEEFTLFTNKRDKVLDMLDGQDDMQEIMQEKGILEKARINEQMKNSNTALEDTEDDVILS